MDDLEELYVNLRYIFDNEKLMKQSIIENLFELDYIKVFVLVLRYFNICEVPKDILELCISGDVSSSQYEEIYKFVSDKWEKKAETEIDDLIFKVEAGVEEL